MFARKLVEIATVKATGTLLDPELSAWADQMEVAKRDKLVLWGLLSPLKTEVSKTIAAHLEDWKASLVAKGGTTDNAQQKWVRAKKVLDGCNYVHFADIDCLEVDNYLADINCSMRTRNHYAGSVQQFTKWMVRNKRASASPLEAVSKVTVTDEKQRRALSPKDFTKLLQTTLDGPMYAQMSGFQRSTLYWLASETGYRAKELRSLTASSVDFTSEPVMVLLEAKSAKNKKRVRLSITPELATQMRILLKDKLPQTPIFKMPTKTAEMMRSDLEAAGIPYTDDAGAVFDFHALRCQLATNLIRAGCTENVAQARLRHSTSKLTFDTYAKLGQSERDSAAVAALPRLSLGA